MDNTVGSLTQFQKSIIIGSVIGDGYIRCIKGRKNAFMEINHSFNQKEYVDWKYFQLLDFVISRPNIRKNGENKSAYRFYTKQHPFFTSLLSLFYKRKKKIIPENLLLDPISLAVWYMDDGSRCRDSDIYFNSQQFDMKSQENLLISLEKFGIYGKTNKDKSYFRIRILKKSISRFIKTVSPYIVPSMRYKLGYDPVETTRRSPLFDIYKH
jgi:hypothetical protein